MTCPHCPPCPRWAASDATAAVPLARHPDQGWALLCNGVVLFDDTGALLPDGSTRRPERCAGACDVAPDDAEAMGGWPHWPG